MGLTAICNIRSRLLFSYGSGKPLECPYCDFGSATKDPAELHVNLLTQQSLVTITPEKNLKRHIYNDHFSKVFKKFRCSLCHSPFNLPELLEEHTNPDLDPAKRRISLCAKLRCVVVVVGRHCQTITINEVTITINEVTITINEVTITMYSHHGESSFYCCYVVAGVNTAYM